MSGLAHSFHVLFFPISRVHIEESVASLKHECNGTLVQKSGAMIIITIASKSLTDLGIQIFIGRFGFGLVVHKHKETLYVHQGST